MLAVLLSACAASGLDRELQFARQSGVPAKARIDVPFVPQRVAHCGPAVLSMAAGHAYGRKFNTGKLARMVFTPGREGTLRPDMIAGARRLGLLATPAQTMGQALREVAAGNPVILFENRGLEMAPVWHFSLLVGYDLAQSIAILHSDQTPFAEMSLDRLTHIWRRGGAWAYVLTRPPHLPETMGLTPLLEAATGLERAKRKAAARAAYGAITQAFPENALAWFAKGNADFTATDMPAARRAYMQAIKYGGVGGNAYNNLAYVLAAEGQGPKACVAARRAQAADTANAGFRDTVAELCRGR